MIPVWPADLPERLLASSFSESLGDGRLRTQMEAGPPKMRRRFSAAPQPVQASVRVNADQKARLERFWDEDTGGGALPFLMRDQTRDGRPMLTGDSVPLLDGEGRAFTIEAWWLVVFGDGAPAFTTRDRGLSFVAAFSLSVLPT